MGQPEKPAKVIITAQTERPVRTLQEEYADVTLRLIEEHGDSFEPMSEDAARKVQRKLHFHIMFLFCCVSLLLFVSVCEYGLWTGPHLRDGIDFA